MNKTDVHPAILDCYLDHPYALCGRIIDPVTGNVSWQGQQVHLQRKDLEVLALLASNNGAVIARASFITVIWGGNDLVGDRGVSDKIFSLRRALQDHDEQQPIIRTIPRRGYQLNVSVVQPVLPKQPAFAAGSPIPGCPGWRLQRRLTSSEAIESWLALPQDEQAAPRVVSFCRSEAHLRRLQRETTLLRYLSETLGERQDLALVRDWQLQEPPYFLARDYCTHASLTEWADAVGGLNKQSLAQRHALMLALAAAVASVHQIGVVHGHLSATSILLDDVAALSGPQLKLSAFDLGALNDHSKLTPLKIIAVGLSFVDGIVAPKIADDIYALGALLLQLAIADLTAEPTDVAVQRIPNPDWRGILAACFGPELCRPSAVQLFQQLSGNTAGGNLEPASNPVPARTAATHLGQTIGPYRLMDKLGEGGMGSVYLAEQRDPVQRQVAVKLIKAGMDTAEVLARFEAERQALALMNHVNVAAVYDAGAAQSGRPYFAMEYVPGLEITAHCDERELDFRERIALFLQVCEGVLHAHQKGIIHRDLKPSNILIKTAQGQPATAKIIDFGVAKSLQRKLGNLTAHTQLGSFVGTRMYSSPEQISGNASAIDTRCDIYSLGVVLYELLTGVAPYRDEDLASKSPVELTRMLSDEEPPALLARFVSLDAQRETDIAARRQMTTVQMKQTLGSDLSWIVAKCLERDPNARYASVLELEKDLLRWLENRPVEARPATFAYRLRKLIRRNRSAVVLGSTVAMALFITTTTAIIGFVRADQALENARVAAEEAEAAADFQVKQLSSLNPAAMGNSLRESLSNAMAQSGKERGLDPTTLAQAQKQLDELLLRVDFTDLTLTQLDSHIFSPAMATLNKDFKAHPELQARLWQSLADILRGLGQNQQAVAPQELALTQRQRLLGENHPLYLTALSHRGALRVAMNQLPEAEVDLRRASTLLSAQLGERAPEALEALHSLGILFYKQGKFAQATSILTDVLARRRLALGDEHPDTLKTKVRLGEAKFRQRNAVAGKALLEEALVSQRRVLGNQHQDTLTTVLVLARIEGALDQTEAAEAHFREGLAGLRKQFGSDDQATLTAIGNLATFLTLHGRLDEAEALFQEAVALKLRNPEDVNNLDVIWKASLVRILMKTGRLAEADTTIRGAINGGRLRLGNTHPYVLAAIDRLAILRQEQGRFNDAAKLFREYQQAWQRLAGNENPEAAISLDRLAHTLQLQGRLREAEPLQKLAITRLRKVFGAEYANTLIAEIHYAGLLRLQGKTAESELHYRKTLAALQRTEGPEDEDTLDCLRELAQLLREQGELVEALALAREAAESARRTLDKRNHRVGVFLTEYGKALMASGLLKDAEPVFAEAWSRLSPVKTVNPTDLRAVIESFIALYGAKAKMAPGQDWEAKVKLWQQELVQMNVSG